MSGPLEPVLNELSVDGGDRWDAAERLNALAAVLGGLTRLGLPRVLRTLRGAMDQPIERDLTLRRALFQRGEHLESRRLVASYLGKAPYIEELLTAAEGECAVDGRHAGVCCHGLTYVALTDSLGVSLTGRDAFERDSVEIELLTLDPQAGESRQTKPVRNASQPPHVDGHRDWVDARLRAAIGSGADLLAQAATLWAELRFGPGAMRQIQALTGREPWFATLCQHLAALNEAARTWTSGPYEPAGLQWSVESEPTLKMYGSQRDFAMPSGFEAERFTLHTKIYAANKRVYYLPRPTAGGMVVIIGYVGDHLPTVRHQT